MSEDFALIRVQRFRTPEGQPTCCADATNGKHCMFLRTSRMGQQWDCALSTDLRGLGDYAGNGMGYLTPGADCPVWAGA